MRLDRQRAVPIALSSGFILVALATCSFVTDAADNSTAASLQIHMIGAREVRLADPMGRVYPRTESAQVAMPDCQSWENVLLRPMSARAAMIPRAQLAIARPLQGTYRIELAGTGQQVYLEFVAWGGDSTTGMQDPRSRGRFLLLARPERGFLPDLSNSAAKSAKILPASSTSASMPLRGEGATTVLAVGCATPRLDVAGMSPPVGSFKHR